MTTIMVITTTIMVGVATGMAAEADQAVATVMTILTSGRALGGKAKRPS
jgi:hypothetical protein